MEMMMNEYVENEIVVRPACGMQLSEGYIRKDGRKILGCLPALLPCVGETVEDVRLLLEVAAKIYYGNDVIVEILEAHAWAC